MCPFVDEDENFDDAQKEQSYQNGRGQRRDVSKDVLRWKETVGGGGLLN